MLVEEFFYLVMLIVVFFAIFGELVAYTIAGSILAAFAGVCFLLKLFRVTKK